MRDALVVVAAAGATAADSFGRGALVDLEAVAAAAGGGGIRVLDLEPGLLKALEKVDRGALQVRRAERVDDDLDAVELQLVVARLGGPIEAERVLEATATAALDRDPEHLGLTGRLLRHQGADLVGGTRGEGDDGGLGLLDSGHAKSVPEGVSIGHFVTAATPMGTRLAASFVLLASGAAEPEEAGVFNDWLPFAIYGVFALAVPATMMIGSFVFATRPHRRVRERRIPFESGVSQGPPARQRFTVSFYLTAMLFILFDIEIVFLYPLAVILHELAWFGFLEFLTFLVILLVAYIYIWKKGALEWR